MRDAKEMSLTSRETYDTVVVLVVVCSMLLLLCACVLAEDMFPAPCPKTAVVDSAYPVFALLLLAYE